MTKAPHPSLPAPVAAALRHFRAQRPLRGGSLIITIFGDAIAPRGGAITLGSLIRLAQPLGLTERLVRTASARLAREGWIVARRSGRRSEYRLSAEGARRFAQATARIYASPPAWDGRWTLLLLPAGRRHAAMREQLRWLGFGTLQPNLLAHPGTTPAQARAWLRDLAQPGETLVLGTTRGDPASDRRLVAAGWDLAELGAAYRRFMARFTPVAGCLSGHEIPGQTAFLVRTLLIHEYRRIHLQDPLLPSALLPARWVGTAAHELAGRIYGQVLAGAEGYLSVTAQKLHGALPPAQAAVRARFGGTPRC